MIAAWQAPVAYEEDGQETDRGRNQDIDQREKQEQQRIVGKGRRPMGSLERCLERTSMESRHQATNKEERRDRAGRDDQPELEAFNAAGMKSVAGCRAGSASHPTLLSPLSLRNYQPAARLLRPGGLAALLGSALALSACVNTRVFTETELGEVGRRCGLAAGEVIQEADHPRFLFLYAVGPTRGQLSCVQRWARRHNMNLAYIEAVDFTQ
jgi:hypothetical protein